MCLKLDFKECNTFFSDEKKYDVATVYTFIQTLMSEIKESSVFY